MLWYFLLWCGIIDIIKILIYYEETFNNDNKYTHSCFLRYASPVSSNHSGFIAVPRVGDEVVISFIDGDPDKPIITGSLYNQENPSLIQSEIVTNKHKTSLTSKTGWWKYTKRYSFIGWRIWNTEDNFKNEI